ncbi:hypothetical protein ACFLUV_02225 [Elusimicrobiota bacterium]
MRNANRVLTVILMAVCVMSFYGCKTLPKDDSVIPAKEIKEEVTGAKKAEPANIEEPTGEILMLADFNRGVKPNLIGGDFGAWDRDPEDTTQYCEATFDYDVKVGNEGFAMKLVYDVESPEPAYNGFWMKLQNMDFKNYSKIVFAAKRGGEEDTEGSPAARFVVELKNAKGEVGKSMVTGITSDWTIKSVPFKMLSELSDFSKMTEFVIVFEDKRSQPKTGVIYIDNIYVAE